MSSHRSEPTRYLSALASNPKPSPAPPNTNTESPNAHTACSRLGSFKLGWSFHSPLPDQLSTVCAASLPYFQPPTTKSSLLTEQQLNACRGSLILASSRTQPLPSSSGFQLSTLSRLEWRPPPAIQNRRPFAHSAAWEPLASTRSGHLVQVCSQIERRSTLVIVRPRLSRPPKRYTCIGVECSWPTKKEVVTVATVGCEPALVHV